MENTKDVSPKILERIRKCLKLAANKSGATTDEASTAMAMARKLMDEHNIQLSDVEVKKELNEGVREVNATDKPKAYTARWEKVMASVCDNLFGTRHYYNNQWHSGWTGKSTTIVFMGVGQDPEVAKESYNILCAIIRKMGSSRGLAGSDLRDYCLGIATTLNNRAWDIKKASEQQPEMSSCRDLVVTKDAMIAAHENSIGLRKARAWSGRYSQHYEQGRQDGKKIDLNMRKAIK